MGTYTCLKTSVVLISWNAVYIKVVKPYFNGVPYLRCNGGVMETEETAGCIWMYDNKCANIFPY